MDMNNNNLKQQLEQPFASNLPARYFLVLIQPHNNTYMQQKLALRSFFVDAEKYSNFKERCKVHGTTASERLRYCIDVILENDYE